MSEWIFHWYQPPLDPEVEAMTDPVRCTYCGEVYDLGHVEVTGRYADCSVYSTPCCKHVADDRTAVSLPAFVRLRRA